MTQLIIAEKPSVARDIGRTLGATLQRDGYLINAQGDLLVSWTIGHVVGLPEPHAINPTWKTWRIKDLPILPESWPLQVIESTKHQFDILGTLMQRTDTLIAATDAGREGELIFRYLIEAHQIKKPCQRLWISSLTSHAILEGMKNLKPLALYDGLADAARARSRADWLVGMNYSRAYTLASGESFFVGRVQTPTLALIVERDQEIDSFEPMPYCELRITSLHNDQSLESVLVGVNVPTIPATRMQIFKIKPTELTPLEDAIKTQPLGKVITLIHKKLREAPPLLYDLTALQQDANRFFGFSAQETLNLAQSLYEKHKWISYPRTDSQYLSTQLAHVPLAQQMQAWYEPQPQTLIIPKRYIADDKITDHHAIIPLEGSENPATTRHLTEDERQIFDLICRRCMMMFQPDAMTAQSRALLLFKDTMLFQAEGSMHLERGWKHLSLSEKKEKQALLLPEWLAEGLELKADSYRILQKKTSAPSRLNDATLLGAMENCSIDDKALQAAMKGSGIGTAATRASIIETLITRNYITRHGKTIESTAQGKKLIQCVHPSIQSAEMTARWEQDLKRIEQKKDTLGGFMLRLENEIKHLIPEILAPIKHPPEYYLPLHFGFTSFRPPQKEVCQSVIDGRDVLLVMPTGAGKSLCYQLPGIARGGTTLVISPLIALMEDQVSKLRARDLQADRIHAGRSREESREACTLYLQGKLNFFFVSPERLSLPGFFSMLTRRSVNLIVIDEAHCISHWGHDFRPSYRLLGEKLFELRPAPILALTATATPEVQRDIQTQLRMQAQCYIQGFRRSNIAIHVLVANPSERTFLASKILEHKIATPAIIYASTRKAAEALTTELRAILPYKIACYHAGMPTAMRDSTQHNFISGDIDIIIATIAFGMGIDKSNIRSIIHAGLPSSVEGYYQEIGRAGRDGLPAKAYLLYGYQDQKMHTFFFERDYPAVSILHALARELTDLPCEKETIAEILRTKKLLNDNDIFEKAFEKLWIHQGVKIDEHGRLTKGSPDWEKSYSAQSAHKRASLEKIIRFASSRQCRILSLVQHFGDSSREPCGICDICAPQKIEGEALSPLDLQLAELIRTCLGMKAQPAGRLFETLQKELPKITRAQFESLLISLSQAAFVSIDAKSFTQAHGETISYRELRLNKCFTSKELATLRVMPTSTSHKKPIVLDEALLDRLKKWRQVTSIKEKVPKIINDQVLRAIAQSKIYSEKDLLQVPGIGPKIVQRFGRALMGVIKTSI